MPGGFGSAYNGSKPTQPTGGSGGFGSAYSNAPPAYVPKAKPKKKGGGGGILGTLGRIPGDFLRGAENAATQSQAALAEITDASAKAILYYQGAKGGDLKPIEKIAKAYGTGLVATAKDPLKDPFTTALTVLPLYGGVARGALAGRAAVDAGKAGESVSKALLAKPNLGPRTLDIPGEAGDTLTATGQYSRATGSAVNQRAVDAFLTRGAAKSPTGRLAQRRNARAAKWLEREERTVSSRLRLPGTTLQTLGRALTPAEVRAIDIVARQVPLDRRIAAQEARQARAEAAGKADEVARHQVRIDLDNEARQFIADGPDGKPVLAPEAAKLHTVYNALDAASSERGDIFAALRLMDREAQHAATQKLSRLAAGGRYVSEEEAAAAAAAAEYEGRSAQRFIDWSKGFLDRSHARREQHAAEEAARAESRAFNAGTRRTAAEQEALAARAAVTKGARSEAVNAAAAESSLARTRLANAIDRKAKRVQKASDKATFALVRAAEGSAPQSRAIAAVAALNKEQRELKALKARHRREQRAATDLAAEQTVRGAAHEAASALADETVNAAEAAAEAAYKEALDHLIAARLSRMGRQGQRVIAIDVRMRDLAERAAAKSDEAVAAARAQAGHVVGADDITVSADAPFIGMPVGRKGLTGRPVATKTFGRTNKPGSLKESTGAAIEHAKERLDITDVVAEAHAEAVRLAAIDRRAKRVSRAGTTVPGRNDDVWVWTDFTDKRGKTHGVTSRDRLDPAVREALDNPDGISRLPDGGEGVMAKLHAAAFESGKWFGDNSARRAELEQAAQRGEGVFVPRKLLGDAGKWNPNLNSSQLGVRILDDINNAQKAALIYLKLNYVVVQSLSNAALNIVQGAANPVHVAEAVRAYRANPVLGSAVEDLMGQGAVVQAAFQGHGAIAHGTQRIAETMSRKVDRPARLNAFAYEARKAGFGGDRMNELVFDPANAQELANVTQRAREAIIDYSELSPAEKALVRRILFVYPWQKGAFKYAGHFLRDHPVQSAALAYLGDRGALVNEQKLGPVPWYLKGTFDFGGGLVNPAGVNVLQTPAQQGEAVVSLLTQRPGPTGASFLNPALGIIDSYANRRDDFGRPLPKNPLTVLRNQFIRDVPAVQVLRAFTSDRSSLARKAFGPAPGGKAFPNPNDAIWRWLVGGLYPRDYSKPALNKNAALEKTGR